ncbi:MAG: hypothetical protein B6U88_03005 [Candidatus Aenigmarchaeota archaeon ex4484_56]|nr:MAG: hypothetical protein B6U88_03005 [Candidatus Aenigmarchaeota archaeon ex4484_56]
MLKKGLALQYIFLMFLFFIVIIVGVFIVKFFYSQSEKKINIDITADVSYMCIQLNDTEISFRDFQDILYGFMTDQCDEFYGVITENLNIDDIKRIAATVNPDVQIIHINECKLPEVNSGNIFVNFSMIKENSNLYLKRRKINNSDILICG